MTPEATRQVVALLTSARERLILAQRSNSVLRKEELTGKADEILATIQRLLRSAA